MYLYVSFVRGQREGGWGRGGVKTAVLVFSKNLHYIVLCRRPAPLSFRLTHALKNHVSTSAIFSVVVRCGGFRALYGWLGDVWERVRAHKMARAGPPEWMGVGGRVYVEELLCVLARVPITVDMLRETVRGGLSLFSGWEIGDPSVFAVCCRWKSLRQ